MDRRGIVIREPETTERDWIDEASHAIGGPIVVSSGRCYVLREFPTLIAVTRDGPAGLAVYRWADEFVELLALRASAKQSGVGSALLAEVEALARRQSILRVRLCTTNDNLDALRFYQRRGFRVVAYRVNGFRDVLRLKGADPDTEVVGHFGILIRDVIELEKRTDA